MGVPLGELFYALAHKIQWTYWYWQQFRILYTEKQSRIVLLNAAAPFFFFIIQRVLFEETVLSVAKMIAPPQSVNRDNLTILRLPPLITEPDLRLKVTELVEEAKDRGQLAMQWRHRHLAHFDLMLALGKSASPLPPISYNEIEDALKAIRDVLNCVELAKCDNTSLYDFPGSHDAESLLYVLRDALKFRKERDERLKNRQLTVKDFEPDEPL